jgi:RNA polymerase sigma-70 factor (ECF subfamily)
MRLNLGTCKMILKKQYWHYVNIFAGLYCKVSQAGFVVRVTNTDLSRSPQDPASMSDNELAKRACHDASSFSDLFDRFFSPVYRYFFIRLRHQQDAEDLTSETFQKIFQKLPTFQERGLPFGAWVFTIAHHTLIDHVRRTKHTVDSLDTLDPSKEPHKDFDLQAIDQQLLSEKLWTAIRQLPEREQQIWALKLTSGLAHKDIANVLGLTENNVNVILHRSFSLLKNKLTDSPLPS